MDVDTIMQAVDESPRPCTPVQVGIPQTMPPRLLQRPSARSVSLVSVSMCASILRRAHRDAPALEIGGVALLPFPFFPVPHLLAV